MKKELKKAEALGVLFIICCSLFMKKLYTVCGGQLCGVMFGAVNDSVWESFKTISLPYVLWGLLELLSFTPAMRRFTVAKTIGLYSLAAVYFAVCYLIKLFCSQNYITAETVAAVVCVCFAQWLSCAMCKSRRKIEQLFYPAVFMLLLFVACYFSFTPFPKRNYLFMDRATGRYGLPDIYDAIRQ